MWIPLGYKLLLLTHIQGDVSFWLKNFYFKYWVCIRVPWLLLVRTRNDGDYRRNYASVVVMVGDSTASSGATPIIITTTRAAFQSWRTTSRSQLDDVRNRLSVAGLPTRLYNHPPHCSCFDRQTRSQMLPERSRKHVKIRSLICQSLKLVGEKSSLEGTYDNWNVISM